MQLSDMRGRVSYRLNEAGTPVFYTAAEINAAINEGLRTFALLTLGLEKTSSWTPGSVWTHMLGVFSDWICPLRITSGAGAKIRPASIEDMAALDTAFFSSNSANRYVSVGADLIGIYPGGAVSVTYAAAPATLAADGDVPQIPNEYHGRLVDYAIYRCRQVEGAQEFQKALKYFDSFLDGAQNYARYVRGRNVGTRYDKVPFELEAFDRSKVVNLRADLMPATELPADAGTALPEQKNA